MSFLAPGFFLAALAVAAGAVALHFLVIRQPPSAALPTARFVPVARVHVVTVARRPEDLLLLLLRVVLALLIGAAFARPVPTPRPGSVARVILADRSAAVAEARVVSDTVRRLARPGDVVMEFDTAARPSRGDRDTASSVSPYARLSTALVAGIRAGTGLRAAADSVELVIVSPFAPEAWDGATAEIRRRWPGRIRLVEVSARKRAERVPGFVVMGTGDDPIGLAAVAAGLSSGDSTVRVIRGAATERDSSWAAAGGTLVRWPSSGSPPGWTAQPIDTVGAVVAGDGAVVFPFERRWKVDGAGGATVAARWVDGRPAAVERRVGRGCVRDIAVPVTPRGDFILRPDFARLLEALTRPCGAARTSQSAEPDKALLAGTGPLASRATLPTPENVESPLVPWLLGAALLLACLELWVRRRPHPGEEPAP